jgi:hypothetical protein
MCQPERVQKAPVDSEENKEISTKTRGISAQQTLDAIDAGASEHGSLYVPYTVIRRGGIRLTMEYGGLGATDARGIGQHRKIE